MPKAKGGGDQRSDHRCQKSTGDIPTLANIGLDKKRAARAWKRAVDDGRVGKAGGDRQSQKASAQSGQMILDPRKRFSELFGAGKNLTQEAYALVTRDSAGGEGLETGGSPPSSRPERMART